MLVWVLAQAAAAVAPAAPQQGVTSYGPDFFAAYRPANAAEMIAHIPGFSLDTGDAVRGYEGAAGNVLIDGRRPATKTDSLGEVLRRIPFTQVARIDVVSGGAPGIDMQGKTVIANVIRKAGGGPRGLVAYAEQFTADGQAVPALRLESGGQWGPRSWEANLYVARFTDDSLGDGPRTRLDAAGRPLLVGQIHARGIPSQTTFTGAFETPLAGGALRLSTRVNVNPYDLNETDFIRLPDRHDETEHDDDNTFQTEFGARYNRGFGARATVEVVALRQDKHERVAADFRAPRDAELFALDARNAESIGRAVLKFQQRPNLSWEAGGEGALNTLDSRTSFRLNGAAIALPAANVTVEEKRGEVFGKVVWRPMTSVTLEGGVRAEGSKISSAGDVRLEKSLTFVKPRVALTWAADADTQVRLRYERVVGQLDFGAFVASQSLSSGVLTAGNPNLEPEKAWVSEAAVERRFLGQGDLVLTLRHSEITDVVDRAPIFQPGGGAFDAPANIGAGKKDELAVNLTLPLDRFGLKGAQLRGQSTWRRSEVIDPTTHQPRRISGLHHTDWEVHFSQDLPNMPLSWGVDVYGSNEARYFRFNEIEVRKVESYVTPFVEWKPRPDLSLRFEWNNATERGFKRTLYHFDGPRGRTPLAFVEDRDPHFPQLYYFRVRKTFGN